MTIDERAFFMKATMNVCRYLEIESAMASCLETIRQVMPAEGLYLQFYDKEFNAFRSVAKATAEGGEKIDKLVPISSEGKRTLQENTKLFGMSQLPDVLIYNNPEEDANCQPMLRFHGLDKQESSLLILTLGIEETIFGNIALHACGHDRYTKNHARLFALLKDPLTVAVSNARKHLEVTRLKDLLADDNRYLNREISRLSGDKIIGKEHGLKHVMNMVKHVAEHDSPVLILGETGVGKDAIANAIHSASSRSEGSLITVNCGAIPHSLLDSELFGHEKGAFTGALSQKRGRFERANGGTIFLDEIGELPAEAQVRLLRVLQNREIERVGGIKTIPVDIRIIAATNRNLEEMVRNGQFREDLWFRLNVFPIMIPPLRARKEDIPDLVDYFLHKKSRSLKLGKFPQLANGAIEQLTHYHWPGNIRELENVVERALILGKNSPVTFNNLGVSENNTTSMDYKEQEKLPTFHQVTEEYLKRILRITNGKINGTDGAASLTGLNPSTLRNKLIKLNIPFGHKKSRL